MQAIQIYSDLYINNKNKKISLGLGSDPCITAPILENPEFSATSAAVSPNYAQYISDLCVIYPPPQILITKKIL